MKQVKLFLLAFVAFCLLNIMACAGTGAIPSGPDIKLLKNNLRFKTGDVKIMSNDTDDPSAVSKDAEIGSLYIRKGSSNLYQKRDSGDTTDWGLLINTSGAGTDECVARWDGTGTETLQDSLHCITDLGAGTGLVSQQIDLLNFDTNRIYTTDDNLYLTPVATGTIVVTEDFLVQGSSTLQLELRVEDALTVTGHSDLNTLQVNGTSTLVSPVTAQDSVLLQDELVVQKHTDMQTLQANGTSTFALDTTIEADLLVTGHSDLNTVDVSGTSTHVGSSIFNDSVQLDDELSVAKHSGVQSLQVNGTSTHAQGVLIEAPLDVLHHTTLNTLEVTGTSTILDLQVEDLTVTDDFTVQDHSDLQSLQVNGTSTLAQAVDIESALTVTQHTSLLTLETSGTSTFSGDLNMASNGIDNIDTATTTHLYFSDATSTGRLDMATNKIINLDDPSAAQDAATKAYVDSVTGGGGLETTGGTMSGNIEMAGNNVGDINIASGTTAIFDDITVNDDLIVLDHSDFQSVQVNGTSTFTATTTIRLLGLEDNVIKSLHPDGRVWLKDGAMAEHFVFTNATATPPTDGKAKLYYKSDSYLYYQDDNGIENQISSTFTLDEQKMRFTGNSGHGSSYVKIRIFENQDENVGTGIFTYATSAANGASFTLNRDAYCHVSYGDIFVGSSWMGVSKNATAGERSINIGTIADANRIALATTAGANSSNSTSWAGPLDSGDVIRPHTEGQAQGTSPEQSGFTISCWAKNTALEVSAKGQTLRLNTATTYGSTNTVVRVFTTIEEEVGSGYFTYATTAAAGMSLTLDKDAHCTFSYTESIAGVSDFGLSKNSTQLTTAIQSITTADRLIGAATPASGVPNSVAWAGRVEAGDVIRTHSAGSAVSASAEVNFSALCRADSTTVIVPAIQTCFLKDVKGTTVNGGTFTLGEWRDRLLNTAEGECDFLSLNTGTGEFTIGGGTYNISGLAPAFKVDSHQAKLRNTSDSTDDIIGTTAQCAAADAVQTNSHVFGSITLTGSKSFKIQHYSEATRATDGMGLEAGSTSGVAQVYTTVKIDKVR